MGTSLLCREILLVLRFCNVGQVQSQCAPPITKFSDDRRAPMHLVARELSCCAFFSSYCSFHFFLLLVMEPTPVSSGMNGDLMHDLAESLRLATCQDQTELADTLGLCTKTEQQELERLYRVIAAGGQLQQDIHGAIEIIIKLRDKYRAQASISTAITVNA